VLHLEGQLFVSLRRVATFLQVQDDKNDNNEEDKGGDKPNGGMINLVMGGASLVTRMGVRRVGE
jgi:hypothetical protein